MGVSRSLPAEVSEPRPASSPLDSTAASRPGPSDSDTLKPHLIARARCGQGIGLAVCPALGLLVTSNRDVSTLSVFDLPPQCTGAGSLDVGVGAGSGAAAGVGVANLTCVRTLGGRGSPPPMQFKFWDWNGNSGCLAFTSDLGLSITTSSHRLLLVTDAGHDAVHVIDVGAGVHVGYVTAPGTIAGPRGVAVRGSLAAVSAWKHRDGGDHAVHLLEGSGASWTPVRVVGGGFGGPGGADGQLQQPLGVRLSADGRGLAVADSWNGRVSAFRVEDGAFERQLATGLSVPYDVEEWVDHGGGGWLVACEGSCVVACVDGDGVVRAVLGREGCGDGELKFPAALALVPALGLAVREVGITAGRVQFFFTRQRRHGLHVGG